MNSESYYKIKKNDLIYVGDAELDAKGLVSHHLDSYNKCVDDGFSEIVEHVFKIDRKIKNERNETKEDQEIESIRIEVYFRNVKLKKPTFINYSTGKEEILYPMKALMEDKTYSASMLVDVNVKVTAEKKDGKKEVKKGQVNNLNLCRVPTMIRSKLCNTANLTRDTLVGLKEDPDDPGGYFIIKGVEWVIENIESILFNQPRFFINMGYAKEICRCEFISKPGDGHLNSDQIIIRLLNTNELTIEIVRDKFKDIQFPFYIFFRILGWSKDKKIFDNIIYNYKTKTAKYIIKKLKLSYSADYDNFPKENVYDHHEVVKYVVKNLECKIFQYYNLSEIPENYKNAYNYIVNKGIDDWFFPHLGKTLESREKKARFLALLIRKLFLVLLKQIDETNRDSYLSKRVFPAGIVYPRSFKTFFNASVIQNLQRKLLNDFRKNSFTKVNINSLITSSIYGADFEKLIVQAIITGHKSQLKVGMKRKLTNRLSSQILNRKNQLARLATLRQVSTQSTDSSKQSARAKEMRQIHMSFIGYIGLVSASTGEKVGINKQLAMFATILNSTQSVLIENKLCKDNDVIILEKLTIEKLAQNNYANIFVNGRWIGATINGIKLVNKYRKMRRELKLHSIYLTIHWDEKQNEINFWCDMGRITQPLLIVYNNKRDPEKFNKEESKPTHPFIQRLAINQDIIDKLLNKTITIDDLVKMQIIEYVTAEEQLNYFIAPDFNILKNNKNNDLKQYTHCYIPQCMLSLPGLTTPFGEHTAIARLIYQTNQRKQSCGYPSLNWPYRSDKETFVQYINEKPMITTYADKFLYPDGVNVMVAIMCYSGLN